MQCRDVMKPATTCRPNQSATECAKIMALQDIGILPVVDDDARVIGVVADRDLAVRVLAEKLPAETPVGSVMTTGIVTCGALDGLRFAERRLTDSKKSRIIVTDDDDKVLGIISLSDIGQLEDPTRAGRVLREVTRREATGVIGARG